jgi:agmatinase
MSTTLKTSRCLDFQPQPNGRVEITHRLVGKKYVVAPDVYKLLDSLQQPRSRQEAIEALSQHYRREDVLTTFAFLEHHQMLVAPEHDETFVVQPVKAPLFGLAGYDPTAPETAPLVVFCGIPYGGGNSEDNNCRHFPLHLRHQLSRQHATLTKQIDSIDFRFLNAETDFGPLRAGLVSGRFRDWGDLYVGPGESREVVHRRIAQAARQLYQRGHVPFFLGGDHSIAWPLILACSEAVPAFQVLHFDAHIDAYQTHESAAFHDPAAAPHHGNFMTRALQLDGLMRVSQLGIRGLVNNRPHKHPKQHIFWADELPALLQDPSAVVLDPDLPVYLTFDIDFLDPQVAPGTATPVAGGLSYSQTCALLQRLLGDARIIGLDFVEVNPLRDQSGITLQVAANLLLTMLNFIR